MNQNNLEQLEQKAKLVTGLKKKCKSLSTAIHFIDYYGLNRYYHCHESSDNLWHKRPIRKKYGYVAGEQLRKAGNGFNGLFIVVK